MPVSDSIDEKADQMGKVSRLLGTVPNQASHRPPVPRVEYGALGRDAMTPEWTRKRTVHPTKAPI
eukprot:scaffold626_cov337-Pavlova_lutheri.AAC.56